VLNNVTKAQKKARNEMWFDGENESFNGVIKRNNMLVNSISISIQKYKITMQPGYTSRCFSP
jgi:hypothetical protein